MSNIDLSGKKIFLAPLNWGLGHATRSMPIINQLLSQNATVILGGDGRSFELLKQEFPSLQSIALPSYDVKYTGNAAMVAVTLLRTPRYLLAIKKEHDLLQEIIKEHKIDFVISDNRYGLFSDLVPTIFICHQISLIPPKLLSFGSPIAYRLHRTFLDRFDHIWIPDFEGVQNLTGKLTLQYPLTDKMAFIGALSRLSSDSKQQVEHEFKNVDIVCVLSGPEPQRTLLEEELIKELKTVDRNVLIVQGKTEEYKMHRNEKITTVSFLKSEPLNAVMLEANVIISRSGYSTIMDLSVLGKKAILIPTPGQTEQEYLANNLRIEDKAIICHQEKLDLKKGLKEVEDIKGFSAVDQQKHLLEQEVNKVFA